MSATDINVLDQLIPIKTVCQRVSLSRSMVYQLIALGEFPKQTYVGTSARWSQKEISSWLEAKLAERKSA